MIARALMALVAAASSDSLDPLFTKYPVDAWFSEAKQQAPFKWTLSTPPPVLSYHQRLSARMTAQVDGREFSDSRKSAEVKVLFQITDENGVRYQDHGTIEPSKIKGDLRKAEVTCTESAFLVPGDYRISVALVFTATGEHFVQHTRLHVSPLKDDPLPGAWNGFPKVEMRQSLEPPDSYYLPSVAGKVPVSARSSRAEVDVILSLHSQRQMGSFLACAIPSLKALVQAGIQNVAVLDLDRRRVAFEQERVQKLDWERMSPVLKAAESGTIDVGSLGNDEKKAEFFKAEIKHRATAKKVVIILTSALQLRKQPPPTDAIPGCRIYYVRFTPVPRVQYVIESDLSAERGSGRREEPRNTKRVYIQNSAGMDNLVHSLKPFGPRVFDIATPEHFRKVLATVLAETSGL